MITIVNPSHPGAILFDMCIEPLGLTIGQAAEALKVSRVTVSAIVNERAGVTADMAVKIAQVFGSTPQMWLRLQEQYDLWHAQKRLKRWKPKHSYREMEQRV